MTDDDKLLASLTGFTPSPWRIRVNVLNDRDICDVSICGDIFVLADLDGPQYAHQQPNAALIAAAPDLHRIATEQAAEIARLRDALSTLVLMSENHSPFGGEMYQDRVDRAWDNARAALAAKP